MARPRRNAPRLPIGAETLRAIERRYRAVVRESTAPPGAASDVIVFAGLAPTAGMLVVIYSRGATVAEVARAARGGARHFRRRGVLPSDREREFAAAVSGCQRGEAWRAAWDRARARRGWAT